MPDDKIRILIVDDVPEGRDGLARLLSFEPDMDVVGFASTGAEAIEQAQELQPHVILMDINMPDMDGITATEQVTQLVRTAVVMISVQSDRDYLRRAMQVGAVDFLPKPPSADDLYASVRAAYDKISALPDPKTSATGRKEEKTKQIGSGKIVVIYSPQGGAGVTTLAVNIASGLMDDEHRTVLMDANLQFGDIAVHLDMRNELNIKDLAKAADDLDVDLIENVLATHGTGLRVLPAPQKPQDADLITADAVSSIVDALAENFGYVVIDTSLHLDDITLTLFDMADVLIMVGIPTLPCVRNLRVVLDLFDHFEDFDPNKIVFVMNKIPTDRKSGHVEPDAISRTLRLTVQAQIPSLEKQMLGALTRGNPVIVNANKSPGKEIVALTEGLRRMMSGGVDDLEEPLMDETKKSGGLLGLFGN